MEVLSNNDIKKYIQLPRNGLCITKILHFQKMSKNLGAMLKKHHLTDRQWTLDSNNIEFKCRLSDSYPGHLGEVV